MNLAVKDSGGRLVRRDVHFQRCLVKSEMSRSVEGMWELYRKLIRYHGDFASLSRSDGGQNDSNI